MGIEERGEIIRHDGRFVDIRIQTAFANTGSHHVPHRQSGALQAQDALFVSDPGAAPNSSPIIGQNALCG